MERIYEILLEWGYPSRAVDWLRRYRLPIVLLMGLLSWVLLISLGWVLWSVVGAIIQHPLIIVGSLF